VKTKIKKDDDFDSLEEKVNKRPDQKQDNNACCCTTF